MHAINLVRGLPGWSTPRKSLGASAAWFFVVSTNPRGDSPLRQKNDKPETSFPSTNTASTPRAGKLYFIPQPVQMTQSKGRRPTTRAQLSRAHRRFASPGGTPEGSQAGKDTPEGDKIRTPRVLLGPEKLGGEARTSAHSRTKGIDCFGRNRPDRRNCESTHWLQRTQRRTESLEKETRNRKKLPRQWMPYPTSTRDQAVSGDAFTHAGR